MRFGYIMLIAMFFNFFGFFIVEGYLVLGGGERITPFLFNKYTSESIYEMAAVFFLCSVFVIFFYFRKKENFGFSSVYIYRKRFTYWVLSAIFLFFSFYNILTANYSFSMDFRGYSQFSRTAFDSLSRLSILLLPAFIFFRVAYKEHGAARLLALFFVFCIAVNSMSFGDRRLLLYFGLSYLLIYLREKRVRGGVKGAFKGGVALSMSMLVMVMVYYFRSGGTFNMGYTVLQSTVGALGIGAILPEVKIIIEQKTGLLMGGPFVTYVWTLFVPSFLLYVFGGDEFVYRSSYLFNEIFNDNPNMGYDFMMLADFYWSFGYVGYIFYILFFFLVFLLVQKGENGGGDFAFCSSLMLLVFFVAGQRSDFGFFLKSFFYCYLVLYLLYWVASEKKGRIADDPR
ncbi:hypothetical protein ACRYJU_06740 [Alloalcanivorax xenomutans]|uniref:hypothetical protein n=1 Tax=Alloalcanivorax xenomutans TaxID=1094342 RepID=UPI003D9BA53F